MNDDRSLAFDKVTRCFGRRMALKELDLQVGPGEILGLVGRNGAGKTTALRLAHGLIYPDSGRIRVLGLDPNSDGTDLRTRVSLLSEESSLYGWMTVARLARAATLKLRELDFVAALKALGASDLRILLVHIVPNALAPVLVTVTLEIGGNILYEAALSFLGLGVQAPVPSWGNMLDNARELIKSEPLVALWPGLLIVLTASCFNFLGDALRDVLDPHHVLTRRRS